MPIVNKLGRVLIYFNARLQIKLHDPIIMLLSDSRDKLKAL